MEKKVLIIGQAPPNQKQEVPYDTTMLYDWLKEVGISKEQAQEIFEFDAVYNKFPGYDAGIGHKTPSREQMDEYWPTLVQKINKVNKIIVFGNIARRYLQETPLWSARATRVLYLIHPSRMNYNKYNLNKEKVLAPLKEFLKEEIYQFSPLNPMNFNPDLVYPEGSIKD